jgi:predicted transcriptional regulator
MMVYVMSEVLAMALPQLLSEEALQKVPRREREEYLKRIILETIKRNQDGVTLQMLKERLNLIGTRTLAKYLQILKYTNQVYTRNFGPTIVYLPNSQLMHPAFERSFPLTDKELKVSLLKNRLGEQVFIQEERRDKYNRRIGAGILIPKDAFPAFVKFLRDASNAMEVK